MPTYFITGTGTHVGKTIATGLIANHFSEKNHTVITQKWVQTGDDGSMADINTHLSLYQQKHSMIKKFKKEMCPYTFSLPASAHLAAKKENKEIIY